MDLSVIVSNFVTETDAKGGVIEADLRTLEEAINEARADELLNVATSDNYHVRTLISNKIIEKLKAATYTIIDGEEVYVSYSEGNDKDLFPLEYTMKIFMDNQNIVAYERYIIDMDNQEIKAVPHNSSERPEGREMNLTMDEEYATLLEVANMLYRYRPVVGRTKAKL